jgi:hypothetical protein
VSLLFNDTYDVTSNFIVGMNIVPISITFQSRVRVVDVDEYDAHSSFVGWKAEEGRKGKAG